MSVIPLLLRLGRRLRRAAAQALADWSERRYEAWRNSSQDQRRY
jgi:hypothetical protein